MYFNRISKNMQHICTFALKTIFNCILLILHLYRCNSMYLTPCHATCEMDIHTYNLHNNTTKMLV